MIMGFLRRMLVADIEPSAADRHRVEETKDTLNQTRGEYRQAVQRVEANLRIMKTWENANRMVKR